MVFPPMRSHCFLYFNGIKFPCPRFEYPFPFAEREQYPRTVLRFEDYAMKIWFTYRVCECPRCRGGLVLRDTSKRLLEHALILVFMFSPYRCGNCGQRFLGFRGDKQRRHRRPVSAYFPSSLIRPHRNVPGRRCPVLHSYLNETQRTKTGIIERGEVWTALVR